MIAMLDSLPAPLSQFSGLGLLWTSLSGAYVIKGLYQAVAGSGTSRDFDGQKGLLRFRKHPVRRHFLGLGMSGAVVIAAYNSYCFGITDFRWLQALQDIVSIPGTVHVSTDEMSALIGTSLLFSHTLSRLYRSVYVNVFSTRSNQDLIDAVSPYIYSVFVGVSLLSEAPNLDGSGFGWFDWSVFSWRHAVGVAAFFFLSSQDSKLQYHLAKLRKNRAGHIVSEEHKLPKGGLYDTVTSAHFLTEILIHGAIGLTLGFKHQTWWLCTGYVAVSQLVRALGRQQWYQRKFEDFPKGRKAILPYIL